MIKTPQKKKSRMHQTPTQTNKSKDFNYSVNYTESLNQMAANLSVYGQLTEIKNKERNIFSVKRNVFLCLTGNLGKTWKTIISDAIEADICSKDAFFVSESRQIADRSV